MSAVATWKAKQNWVGNTTIIKDFEQTLPSKQDKEDHGVPPPAKKQKIEPQIRPSEPQPPKRDNKSKSGLLSLPVPWHSQNSTQATGTRDSPIDVDEEEARDKNETSRTFTHTQVPHDETSLDGEFISDGEEKEALDSE